MNKTFFIYFLTLTIFCIFAISVIYFGEQLQHSASIINSVAQEDTFYIMYNLKHPIAVLLLQIILIIGVAKIFGLLMQKIGQPSVIGEILAGIVLGPSLLGWAMPDLSSFIFAKNSLSGIFSLSQIGLILFMFLIGMELDLKILKEKTPTAIAISHASIIFPFALGMGLSYFIYKEYAPINISFVSFSLFIGIAMSITAFPVLARILKERNLTKTDMGSMALAIAAADDVTAWCVLAGIIAIAKAGDISVAFWTIAFSTIYLFIIIKYGNKVIEMLEYRYKNRLLSDKTAVVYIFMFILLSSVSTELIGIHALFGAFMSGVILSKATQLKQLILDKVEDIATLLFLPLFFAFTGLRTQIGLLNSYDAWLLCGVVILLAILGKFGGSFVAAKATGLNTKDASAIGILMNTRGLMELVVLNIGYDLGILSPKLFAIFVIMALITTVMTSPILSFVKYKK